MRLQLQRPLVFFDLETTGINLNYDRIVEMSIVKIFPDGNREVKTRRLNPEMPIPTAASEIHGIYDADVANEPTFKAVSRNLFGYLLDCDLGGYNIGKFDVPMLVNEFRRAGLEFSLEGRRLIDAYVIFCRREPRTLTAALSFYCGKTLEGAHGAEADTLAAAEVFFGQLDHYPDLSADLDELHQLCTQRDPSWIDSTGKFKWSGNVPVVGFGKNVGLPLKQISMENPGFLQWMIKADFPEDAKNIARDAMGGRYPEKPAVHAEE